MAAEPTAAEHPLDATTYIQHHLTFLAKPVGESGRVLDHPLRYRHHLGDPRRAGAGLPVAGDAQGHVRGSLEDAGLRRASVDFVNEQVRSLFHHDYKFVAPVALTVFVWVLFMNAMDFLPVDVMAWIYEHVFHLHTWRSVPTADVNTTFALALSVFVLMIYYSIKIKGLGGWLHELVATPFGIRPLWASPLLIAFNVLFNLIEYISKPLSHSLRLYGNMYAGEIIFLLLGLWAATGVAGVIVGGLLHVGWSIFHILIVALQAYIFMMLTVVYIAMAHEHH